MDIARQSAKKRLKRRHVWIGAAVAVVLAVFVAAKSFGGAYTVDRDKVTIAEVKRGDFAVQIRGIGTLAPKNIQWLAANVDGHLERIVVEAGADVKRGDVIAVLGNPKLQEQLQESRWELEAQIKEDLAAEASLRSELADLRADARDAELSYRSARVKLDAEQQLVDQGIVSKVQVQQSRIAVEQQQGRIGSQQERVRSMQQNLIAVEAAHRARQNKLRNAQKVIEQQIADLTVRASIDGVVQEMSLKLGQAVAPGTQVARIAPHDDLVALLDIQDFQVRDVAVGQIVSIDTRSSKITGRVARIDPAVSNGVVKVEVALIGKLPPEARPDLSVDGLIDVARKHDVLYVERPTFAKSHGAGQVYVLDGDDARRTPVEFGQASVRSIEVIRGLKVGDRVIVSDPSSWDGHDSIVVR